MFLKRSGKALALFPLLLAAGCSTVDSVGSDIGHMFSSSSDSPIRIESDPEGADVYVMGEKVGVTPLKLGQRAVFPNTYPKDKESLYGQVTLKKAGCSDYTKSVNAKIVDVGLKAKLECGASSSPSASSSSGSEVREIREVRSAPRLSETVEQRLEHIKELLDKGLITSDEARKAREHVINDL